MVKIKFNNQALKRSAYYQQIDQATITINDQDFQLSRSYAVALSDKFLSKYINNQQYNHFQINVNLESTNAYDLFKSIISNQLSEFDCDEVVLRDIFHIGILLQSDDLKSLYINNVINKLQPEFKNSLKILECYFELECEDEMNEWIDNVASHFYEIDFNEMKQYALKHGFDIMQRILSNPHLRIESEDY